MTSPVEKAVPTVGWKRPSTAQLLLVSAALQLGLLLYANHVDTHPERYGGLKYTDVDWRVISDGARLIWSPAEGHEAQGWLTRSLGWRIGDPYNRATFRYTPLLALLISPSLLHPLLGRFLLVLATLAVPMLLQRLSTADSKDRLFWPVHLIWTLNPFVLNITTRGSPEAIICLLIVMLLFALERASSFTQAISRRRWEDRAAICLALGVSYKIYPVIYVPTIWASLARKHGWLGWPVWRFAFVAFGTFLFVNGALWSIWGEPFLQHTFLYHLARLDHRHNFSPYFYPIYLSLFPSGTPPSTWEKLLDHPLMSFLPQATLTTVAGFTYGQKGQLAMGMFVQTWIFVMFNKVCTSQVGEYGFAWSSADEQYFMWGLPLLPLLVPHLKLSARRTSVLVGAWVAGQALWLATAYQLEFLGKSVHLGLWAAGCVLLVISSWVLGEIIVAYDVSPPHRDKAASKRD